MTELKWTEWNGSHLLVDLRTGRNTSWVQYYPDLGWSIELWDDNIKPQGNWERIAYHPDLEVAKALAKFNVEGTLV